MKKLLDMDKTCSFVLIQNISGNFSWLDYESVKWKLCIFFIEILFLLHETVYWLIHFNFSIEHEKYLKKASYQLFLKNNKWISLSLFFHTFLELQIYPKKLHCS